MQNVNDVIGGRLSNGIISFLRSLSECVSERNIPVVFLRGHEDLPECQGFDLDLLVGKGAISNLRSCITKAAEENNLVCTWRSSGADKAKSVIFDLKCQESRKAWVFLDIQSEITFSEDVAIRIGDARLDKESIAGLTLPVLPPVDRFLCLFLDSLRKGKIGLRRERLQAMYEKSMPEADVALERMGLRESGRIVKGILCENGDISEDQVMNELCITAWNKKDSNTPTNRRVLSRFVFYNMPFLHLHKPLVYSVNGADGVGKSTAVDMAIQILSKYPLKFKTFHHTSEWKKKVREKSGDRSSAFASSAGSGLRRDKQEEVKRVDYLYPLRLSYRALPGFLKSRISTVRSELRYASRVNSLLGRAFFAGEAVLVDRYIYDRVTKMKFAEKTPFQRWACWFTAARVLRKPSKVIILTDDPASIYERKQELSVAQIDEYQKLFQANCDRCGVETESVNVAGMSPLEVAQKIVRVLLCDLGEEVVSMVRRWEKNVKGR